MELQGIATLNQGLVKGKYIIREHARLGSWSNIELLKNSLKKMKAYSCGN